MILTLNWKILASNLSPEADSPDFSVWWFFPVPLDTFQANVSITTRKPPFTFLPVLRSFRKSTLYQRMQ
jgi:hypothetical protein